MALRTGDKHYMTTNLVVFNFSEFCEILVSQSGADKESNLLICYTVYTNK
jgi:hypothetical protein